MIDGGDGRNVPRSGLLTISVPVKVVAPKLDVIDMNKSFSPWLQIICNAGSCEI